MGKHSFSSNYRNRTPSGPEQKDSRFIPDHEPMKVYEIHYIYSYGIFSETTNKSLSKRIAKWGLIPLVGSIIIGILDLCGIMLDDIFVKSVLLLTGAFFMNALFLYIDERRLRRDLLGLNKPKKKKLRRGSVLCLAGFLTILTGMNSYPEAGIFAGTIIFIGCLLTLVGFTFLHNSPKSQKRFGLRELLMLLFFLPAMVAFFAFFIVVVSFFGEHVFH